jgi:hypothetical protein
LKTFSQFSDIGMNSKTAMKLIGGSWNPSATLRKLEQDRFRALARFHRASGVDPIRALERDRNKRTDSCNQQGVDLTMGGLANAGGYRTSMPPLLIAC